MEQATRGLAWKAIVIALVVTIVLWLAFSTLVTISYGLYVGFQTRGDSDAINAQLALFTRSMPYILLSAVALGGLIFWRGTVMARTSASSFPSMALVVILAVVTGATLGRVAGGLPFAPLLAQGAVQLAIALAAAYASTNRPARAARRAVSTDTAGR